MDNRRLQLLQRMGVDVWVRREAEAQGDPVPDVGEPEPVTPVTATAEEASRPGAPAADTAPAPPDATAETGIESMDWEALAESVAGCTRCSLCESRTRTVFGVGRRDADILVVGEAPGAEEDRQGEPFVGRAGQLLDSMLRALGYGREQVFIANMLKCRPPRNRDPDPREVEACRPYLARQIELVQPAVILAVGRIAAQNLLGDERPLRMLRRQVHTLQTHATPVVVSYHPAYLLRSPADKAKAWDDLKRLRELVPARSGEGGTA
ncbi:uracil-DNA glycosylase [Aquisalimonas asiatica]|uniref:Type-4 uracil-DNA glycosylase n=1 Tax=Aquisalimonas asiatica TaxID=406100 RepID=A0A1H8R0A5_9GAMM|nr:uracil-DNA glycosylase [Aquisalimonas asiatica]SEO60019.1 DNA polymerase [Aquisalimonas asiatica]